MRDMRHTRQVRMPESEIVAQRSDLSDIQCLPCDSDELVCIRNEYSKYFKIFRVECISHDAQSD